MAQYFGLRGQPFSIFFPFRPQAQPEVEQVSQSEVDESVFGTLFCVNLVQCCSGSSAGEIQQQKRAEATFGIDEWLSSVFLAF